MDDTQQSRTSDAAATRKRRSSILKSQRPPRAPLSELEFHVTTPTLPTDIAKSRRVSFSRRTGVAEFVTNEATTTWKNFYEEHNKTLESSGNESEVNPPRQSSVGHLGKRIFEDCEAIDFGSSSKADYNNIALDSITDDRKLPTQQQNFELSALTATDSKLFEDNFAVSRLGEITDKIDVDFSIMQPIGDDLDEIQKDIERVANNAPNVMCQGPVYNMSEYIEVDLNATHGGLAADDAASDDMSITDTIHSPKVNVSSIAEPKDKSLDKDWVTDKENIAVNPYITPKETNNFAINEESDKVLVFDGKRLTIQSEKEPLSDYRKTLLPNAQTDKIPPRKTIVLNVDDDLPNFVANPHASMIQHSQNISLSITAHEEFDVSLTQPIEAKIDQKQISLHENVNMHIPLSEVGSGKRRTIVYDSDADISMTQALPSNVILDVAGPLENDVQAPVFEDEIVRKEKRNTIVFNTDSADVSMTQAVPANIILNIKGSFEQSPNNTPVKRERKTIVFDNDAADISVTQALPVNIVLNATELPEPVLEDHILVKEKRKTIMFDNDAADISVTQALPAKVILNAAELPEPVLEDHIAVKEKRRTIVFDNDAADISVTQALPANIVLNAAELPEPVLEDHIAVKEKRKTIMFDNDAADISVTQALSANIILNSARLSEPEHVKMLSEDHIVQKEKRKTVLFANDDADISVTQALSANVILNAKSLLMGDAPDNITEKEKRKTIVFDSDSADISMTQALPTNFIINEAISSTQDPQNKNKTVSEEIVASNEKRKTIVFDSDSGDISMTQALPTNFINEAILSTQEPQNKDKTVFEEIIARNEKRKTIVYDSDSADISMTQALPTNFINEAMSSTQQPQNQNKSIVFEDNIAEKKKRKTIVFDNDAADISVTQALPTNLILNQEFSSQELPGKAKTIITEDKGTGKEKRKTIIFDNDDADVSMTEVLPSNMIVDAAAASEKKTTANKRKTIVYDGDLADISVTQAVPANVILSVATLPENKIKAIVFEDEAVKKDKRKTVGFENDAADVSATKLPANVMFNAPGSPIQEPPNKRKTIVLNNEEENISLTQPLPVNFVITEKGQTYSVKRRTIVYETDIGSISMTENVPPVKSVSEKSNIIIVDENEEDISFTKTVPLSDPPNEEAGLTYDVLPQRRISEYKPSVRYPQSNKNYSEGSDLDISKSDVLPSNKTCIDMTVAGGDDISFDVSSCKNIILGDETRKAELELTTGDADISAPANLTLSENDKYTESMKKEVDISPPKLPPNEEGNAIEKLNSKTSETTPKIDTKLSASELDVIENTEPIPKKSLPPAFAPSNAKKLSALIAQENVDALSKPTNEAEFIVYQAAITGNQLGVFKNEILSADSDHTESGSSNESYRDPNVAPFSEPSDMERNEFKAEPKSTSAQSLSDAVPSVMDKSCSVIKIDNSSPVCKTKTSILDSLLDMDDSLISNELLEKGLSTIEVTSPVCIARSTSPALSEKVFRITREKEDRTQQSGDAEKQRKEITKQIDKHESSLLASAGNKRGATPSPTKSPGKRLTDSAKKESPKRNRFFEKITRRSKEKQRKHDDTGDLLDKITKLADTSNYEETKGHGKAKLAEKEMDTIKEQDSAKKESPARQTNAAASKRPSITRSPEKFSRRNSVAAPKRQSIIDNPENISRRTSLAVRRQSIVLSREELMNNISMAAQALRETNSPDITEDSPPSPDPEPMEVVKTLNFDDDETPEHDYNSQLMTSPLKKSFGDTQVEETRKTTVIPFHCENVSDGVKSLMMDLLKPMTDTLPFDVAVAEKREELREIHVPVRLIPNSNEETESDSCGSTESLLRTRGIMKKHLIIYEKVITGSTNSEEEFRHQPRHEAMNNVEPTVVFDPINPLNNVLIKPRVVESVHRYNPDPTPKPSEIGLNLDEEQKTDNEVRFKPDKYGGVAVEVFDETKQFVTANYNVQSVIPDHKTTDVNSKTAESKSVRADASIITCGSVTKDQKVNTVIAMQENATILRGNSSLTIINSTAVIGAGENPKSPSKHTEDSHKHSKHSGKHTKHSEECSEKHTKHTEKHTKDIKKEAKDSEEHSRHSEKHIKHSVKHNEGSEKHSKDSENHGKDNEKHNKDIEKHTKHNDKHMKHSVKHNEGSEKHSKDSEKHGKDTKHSEKHNKDSEKHTKCSEKHTKDDQKNALYSVSKTESDPQITEDTNKRKHSSVKHLPSPFNDLPDTAHYKHEIVEEKFTATHERSPAHKKSRRNSTPSKNKSPKVHTDVEKSREIKKENNSEKFDQEIVKPNTIVTVHHCAILNDVNSSEPNVPHVQTGKRSETESERDDQSITSKSSSCESLPPDSQPQMRSPEQSSKHLVSKCRDDVDVCELIRNMPFMGSSECIWESVTSEEWRFLMLHRRLELVVRLSPKHTRDGFVGSNTPVTSVAVLPTYNNGEKRKEVELCVRFALETMHSLISERTCSEAGSAAAVVRRCAAVARVAERWAKAMHHAWAHLAYQLDDNGLLTLKVANFHVRTVWEVRMQMELSRCSTYAVPFPRVTQLTVSHIFGECKVRDAEVESIVKNVKSDWGHAPTTLWKIFRYLKKKTHQSDLQMF